MTTCTRPASTKYCCNGRCLGPTGSVPSGHQGHDFSNAMVSVVGRDHMWYSVDAEAFRTRINSRTLSFLSDTT